MKTKIFTLDTASAADFVNKGHIVFTDASFCLYYKDDINHYFKLVIEQLHGYVDVCDLVYLNKLESELTNFDRDLVNYAEVMGVPVFYCNQSKEMDSYIDMINNFTFKSKGK